MQMCMRRLRHTSNPIDDVILFNVRVNVIGSGAAELGIYLILSRWYSAGHLNMRCRALLRFSFGFDLQDINRRNYLLAKSPGFHPRAFLAPCSVRFPRIQL